MASAQQPAPSCRPQSRTRHIPCVLPPPPSARLLASLPAALRLPARHRGRVLHKAAGQWARRVEPIRPMGVPLGPGGGRSRDGAGRIPDPLLLVLCSTQGLCARLWSSRGDGGTFPPWRGKSQDIRARVSARPWTVGGAAESGVLECIAAPSPQGLFVPPLSLGFVLTPGLLPSLLQMSPPALGPRAPGPDYD